MARLAQIPIPLVWYERHLCEDLSVMLRACSTSEQTVSVGASGTAMRLLTARFALATKREMLLVSPAKRMTERPILQLIELLNQLGASVSSPDSAEFANELYPLVYIKPTDWLHTKRPQLHLPREVDSSQIVSALLLIAPYLPYGLSIVWDGVQLPSASYIQLTTSLMRYCGIRLTVEQRVITVAPGVYDKETLIRLLSYPIGDWSSAQYPLQWTLMTPKPCRIYLTNLPIDSIQPDAHALELLQIPHSLVETADKKICLDSQRLQEHLHKLDFKPCSLSDNPDFAPTLVALLLFYKRQTQLLGLDHLRFKESDRISLVLHNAEQLGYHLTYSRPEGFRLNGKKPTLQLSPAHIITHADHRMVMAWAPFGWYKEIEVEMPQAVDKSYPTFWQDLQKLSEVIASPLHIIT